MSRTHHQTMPWQQGQSVLSDSDFQRFRALILERAGLVFDDKRREVVAQALVESAHRVGDPSLDRYFSLLSANPTHSNVWEPLVSALTVNETYFFRDTEQINVLQQRLLPQIINRRQSQRRLRLWSAGCSTGEEPYTLAILLHQLIPDLELWDVLITATDIDRQALRQAELACYREWSFRDTGAAIRHLYFTANGDSLELHPHLRRLVSFNYLNLAEDVYPLYDVDLILCRNVAIYLPEPAIRTIAKRFHHCLTPGGWLIVGASETNDQRYHPFQPVNLHGITVYQKAEDRAEKATSPIPALFPFPDREEKCAAPAWFNPLDTPPLPSPTAAATKPQTAQPDAAALYRQGEDFLRQRQLADARRCFETCLSREPNHSAACRQLARLEANAGRLADARRWVEKALEQEPLQCESHYLLALIQQEQGEMEAAVARFKKVIYLYPDFILAHVHLGDLYQKQSYAVEAARHRAQALRLVGRLSADAILPGSDDLTAGQVLALLQHNSGH